MLKILKVAALTVAALFVMAQFAQPARTNPPVDASRSVEAHLQMTPRVASALERACRDCHSNRTEWPWYSKVAPVSWFVADHVNHGRRHLNFSAWAEYGPRERVELLEDIYQTVKLGSMPLDSYVLLHPEARLSDEERAAICEWAMAERGRLLAETGRPDESGAALQKSAAADETRGRN